MLMRVLRGFTKDASPNGNLKCIKEYAGRPAKKVPAPKPTMLQEYMVQQILALTPEPHLLNLSPEKQLHGSMAPAIRLA
jgi:hypothetical protein